MAKAREWVSSKVEGYAELFQNHPNRPEHAAAQLNLCSI